MSDVPLDWDKMAWLDAMNSGACMHTSVSQTAGPPSRGLAMASMGPGMQGPSRPSWGRKPPLKVDNMEIVDFLADEDMSDYGQSSEEEEEEEEGETPAQRFQCVQQNKKLAKKKANRAEAAATLARRVQNNFSGRIPDGLEVKIWGPLNVERLNSFFRGALGPLFYYSYRTNTVLVGANANRAAAYEFSSGNVADMPRTMVYKFARRGFPCTPYELERLFRYCANLHVPRHDRIVAFMLISELQSVAQHLDTALQDRTMQILLQDPSYQDLPNPIQGPEDMAIIEQRHIPMRFLRTKDDGTSALRVMRAPDPKRPFDLKQIAQYALIYGQPGLENTWQGIARLAVYGTPPAIPNWDGWREISEEDHYRLLFKRANEMAMQQDPEAIGLYYYIGMDPNVGHLWKRTPEHGTMPVIGSAINIALTDAIMVDVTAAGGPSTPPKTESAPHPPAINIAQPETATTTEVGGAQTSTGTG
ncbi:hypothetical protein C0993_006637 [Termitomyces sp. T159_Od127]|nr:hypothetical protein C0993_006637 [Termitomyces sp. T159_Od127]